VEGLRRHVREHVRLARHFTALVEQDPDLEIAVPPPLNLVCFRHRGGDEVNRRIMHTVNDSGALFLTHTVLAGALTLRMSIGQTHTEQRHIDAAWEAIRTAARSATG
jgi:aromatic-L-amino-acid decarboxylase